MIPIYLDASAIRIAVVGRGALALRRVHWLRHAGAAPDVWSDAASDELAAACDLRPSLPSDEDLVRYHAVWIADLSQEEAASLVRAARAANVLVNVEDQIALCDFHTPAVVRRGKLTLAAGTGGASPAVARAAREQLEAAFPESWERALDEIAEARKALRERNAGSDALIDDARARLARRGLG
jgi:precorrin-2 dehydrogenase/sirohydrochlorin ferrochelatase